MADELAILPHDLNPTETQEWLQALNDVLEFEGPERARELLLSLLDYAGKVGVAPKTNSVNTPYLNTIPVEQQAIFPDEAEIHERSTALMRWNAIAMVMRAGKTASELGGHIASYGSVATLFEIGLTYFFKGNHHPDGGDLVFFQGHSSPGIYARAYLEGRLSEDQLRAFRQEISHNNGLSSYPHPWLMPDFWQLPTVSMGLGPLMGIYQARFLKYLHNRRMAVADKRKVWVFCGDGEMGEPESLGALNLAGREQLDNLIFVINCNLQRLDGPVWGNGQIVQEYEGVFRGAGWNVIKVIWGSGWDELFSRDHSGILQQRISELVDGEYQNYSAKDGAFMREHFFGKYDELRAMVADYTDEDLKKLLLDGGHDPRKVYAAYAAAVAHTGQPTVILAKTVKGYGMGMAGEGLNVTHQTKKMSVEALYAFRERFKLPVSDEHIEHLDFYHPGADSPEVQFLHRRRQALGGYVPAREVIPYPLAVPGLDAFAAQLEGSQDREISSTMVFVRILAVLLKDPTLSKHIVPILADESRTFGMEGLFRQLGIYSFCEQKYTPEDRTQLLYYREATDGQLLQEGISEAGAMASWIAAATSYANSQLPMIPFYIYYSMFGYQRFGDLCWAAGDMRARGFILGGTAGRTTLAGEGLQHQDGHNLLMFSFVPNCVSYDPCFSYELAVIMQHGLKRMVEQQEDVYYYITLMNENYSHPTMPEGAEEDIIKGMYLFKELGSHPTRVQLLGAGTIFREVIKAAEILDEHYQVSSDIWGVTSFNELHRDIRAVKRHNRLHPGQEDKQSHVRQCLANRSGPVVAATDYIQLYAEQIRGDIGQPYYVLGTDGFGRSDTRVALRHFFEVDAKSIVYTTLKALHDQGQFELSRLQAAMQQLKINPEKPDPVTV